MTLTQGPPSISKKTRISNMYFSNLLVQSLLELFSRIRMVYDI